MLFHELRNVNYSAFHINSKPFEIVKTIFFTCCVIYKYEKINLNPPDKIYNSYHDFFSNKLADSTFNESLDLRHSSNASDVWQNDVMKIHASNLCCQLGTTCNFVRGHWMGVAEVRGITIQNGKV